MKFGVCVGTDIEKMKYIKALGYDYAEGHCQEIARKDKAYLDEMKKTGLPVVAANCFIGLRIVGEEKNYAEIDAYLENLFENASYLGLRYLVFGSSGARRIPDGMTLEEGRAEIIDFLKNHVVPLAEKYNIIIAIEPLRPEECNAINTVADGVEVAKAVDSPLVKVLADVAHMYVQNESVESLLDYKGWIVHAHTSNPDPDPSFGKKRIYPAVNDKFSQASFVDALKEIGVEYCSIEADVQDFESDAKNAYEILKELNNMKLNKNDVVLFSGDSITDGDRGKSMDCNHIMGHGYQYIVASKLALENAENMPKFINKGYSGENAEGLLEKWQEDVIENKPTILSILVGVNDGGYGYFAKISPDETAKNHETNLRAILEKTRSELGDIKIIVCEPFYFPLDKSDYSYKFTPHPDGVEGPFKRPDSNDPEDSVAYRDAANKRIRAATKKLAEEFDCIFVPLYDKIKENAERSRMEYFIWDGTHPSIAGHMIIAQEWLKAVEGLDKA